MYANEPVALGDSIPPWNDPVPLELTLLVISPAIIKCSNEPVPEVDTSPLAEIYPNEPVAAVASTPPINEPVPLALTAPLISPTIARCSNEPVPLALIPPSTCKATVGWEVLIPTALPNPSGFPTCNANVGVLPVIERLLVKNKLVFAPWDPSSPIPLSPIAPIPTDQIGAVAAG